MLAKPIKNRSVGQKWKLPKYQKAKRQPAIGDNNAAGKVWIRVKLKKVFKVMISWL